jgi:hypothetical protein
VNGDSREQQHAHSILFTPMTGRRDYGRQEIMKVVNRVETESPFIANDWAITLYKDWMETRHAIIKKYNSQIKRCKSHVDV